MATVADELPRVTLAVPRMVQQNGDIAAVATFYTPSPPGVELPTNTIPQDARFIVKPPGGFTQTFARTHPNVRLSGGALTLAVRATQAGDWIVRVEGHCAFGGQQILVPDERLVHVAASAFA